MIMRKVSSVRSRDSSKDKSRDSSKDKSLTDNIHEEDGDVPMSSRQLSLQRRVTPILIEKEVLQDMFREHPSQHPQLLL